MPRSDLASVTDERHEGHTVASSDADLVEACRKGDQQAWTALINKYQRLIYSVPLKYGLGSDDAADVFQNVCIELLANLGNLRKIESLKSWLIQVALNRCYHVRKQQRAHAMNALEELADEPLDPSPTAPEILVEVEREEIVRQTVRALPPRCATMIEMLFFDDPPIPYAEVAHRLGLATGSIGFIRGRCLERLEKALRTLGF